MISIRSALVKSLLFVRLSGVRRSSGCVRPDTSHLIRFNGFWCDFGLHVVAHSSPSKPRLHFSVPFLSRNVAEACSSFTEMVMALAVMALPFETEKKVVQIQDNGRDMVISCGGGGTPLLVFHKQMLEAPVLSSSVAVSQHYYDPSDPYTETREGRVDK